MTLNQLQHTRERQSQEIPLKGDETGVLLLANAIDFLFFGELVGAC
jgi:hypothetical protein